MPYMPGQPSLELLNSALESGLVCSFKIKERMLFGEICENARYIAGTISHMNYNNTIIFFQNDNSGVYRRDITAYDVIGALPSIFHNSDDNVEDTSIELRSGDTTYIVYKNRVSERCEYLNMMLTSGFAEGDMESIDLQNTLTPDELTAYLLVLDKGNVLINTASLIIPLIIACIKLGDEKQFAIAIAKLEPNEITLDELELLIGFVAGTHIEERIMQHLQPVLNEGFIIEMNQNIQWGVWGDQTRTLKDFTQAQRWLNLGADINARYGKHSMYDHDACSPKGPNFTALISAVACGETAAIQFLVKNGVDPTFKPDELVIHNTPLQEAVFKREKEYVELFLKAGFKPDNCMIKAFLGLREWLIDTQESDVTAMVSLLVEHGDTTRYEHIVNCFQNASTPIVEAVQRILKRVNITPEADNTSECEISRSFAV